MKTLLTSLAVLLLTACGTAENPSTTLADGGKVTDAKANVEPGTFRLFISPGGPRDTRCAFFTELKLMQGFQAPVAQLENGVAGECDVLVDPERRVYNLGVTTDSCGTKHLASEGLEILDNRGRFCKDVQPAKIILTQTDVQGFVTTQYSDDRVGQVQELTMQGTLLSVQAIGGETTGYGLKQADGSVQEVDLQTNGFASSFVEGTRVELKGQIREIHGVEIALRKVLVVTELTVL